MRFATIASIVALAAAVVPAVQADDSTVLVVSSSVVTVPYVRIGGFPAKSCGLEYAFRVDYYYSADCATQYQSGTATYYSFDADAMEKTIYSNSDCNEVSTSTVYSDDCISTTTGTRTFTSYFTSTSDASMPTNPARTENWDEAFIDAVLNEFALQTPYKSEILDVYYVNSNGYIERYADEHSDIAFNAIFYDVVGYQSLADGYCSTIAGVDHYLSFTATGSTGYYIDYASSDCKGASTVLGTIYTAAKNSNLALQVPAGSTTSTLVITTDSTAEPPSTLAIGFEIDANVYFATYPVVEFNSEQSTISHSTTTAATNKITTTAKSGASTATNSHSGAAVPTGVAGMFPFIAAGVVAGGALLI